MVTSKEDFIRTFLPNSIKEVSYAQLDLDISDLSISDVLRNINKVFPDNSRNRNSIISGNMAVAVLCKSELLYPISGILLLVVGEGVNIELVSKNYIIISVPETHIVDDDHIKKVLDNVTNYVISNFKDTLKNFNDFYIKFIYDPYEEEAENYGMS